MKSVDKYFEMLNEMPTKIGYILVPPYPHIVLGRMDGFRDGGAAVHAYDLRVL